MRVLKLDKKTFYDSVSSDRFHIYGDVKLYKETIKHAYYIEQNKSVEALGGLFPWWDGVGEVWMIPADDIQISSIMFIKAMGRLIDNLIRDNNLWRIQATAEVGEEHHCRLLRVLGFEKEGLMRKFGPDKEDHFRYAKVK